MADLDDIPEPTREHLLHLECATPSGTPFVSGPPLHERKLAVVSSAAIHPRGEPPFQFGTTEYRQLPATTPAADIVMSHVSVNFDRTGFQRDLNVIYPMDRLRELVSARRLGSLADTNYIVMGSTDPRLMEASADGMVRDMWREGVDAILYCPV